jgi:hypothetical protein
MHRERRSAAQGKVILMKHVFKIERKSDRSKFYLVTKILTDDDGRELGPPQPVSRPLSYDQAVAFRDRCEKEHLFE